MALRGCLPRRGDFVALEVGSRCCTRCTRCTRQLVFVANLTFGACIILPARPLLRRTCFATMDHEHELELGRVYGCHALYMPGGLANLKPRPAVFMGNTVTDEMGHKLISIFPVASISNVVLDNYARRFLVPVLSPNSEIEAQCNDDPWHRPIQIEPPLPIDISYVFLLPFQVRLAGVYKSEDCNTKEYRRLSVVRKEMSFVWVDLGQLGATAVGYIITAEGSKTWGSASIILIIRHLVQLYPGFNPEQLNDLRQATGNSENFACAAI